MRAVNLYSVSRKVDKDVKPLFEKALSDRETALKIRDEEIGQIRELAMIFSEYNVEMHCYEDWFYSFSIPQIGKEFDLVKIGTDNTIINIELKSQEVALDKIEKQLVLNRHYFSHIADKIYSFTFVNCEDGFKIYKYDGKLSEANLDELVKTVSLVKNAVHEGIENLFRPRDYLISPINTPEKYLEGKYYLTNLQEIIKDRIMDSFSEDSGLWGINGAAGTGKTLLMYDLVRNLAKHYRIAVIHCGVLSEGHKYIGEHLDNVDIVTAESVTTDNISDYDIVCVDETQRLGVYCLKNIIIEAYERKTIKGCIFAYDEYQTLSKEEEHNDIKSILRDTEGYHEERLTDRIRTNREVNWFIRNMLSLKDKAPSFFNFDNIDVVYANDKDEAERLVDFYKNKDYVFIDYASNDLDADEASLNSHTVIGQEFDNVVMIIDSKLYYNERGELTGAEDTESDYLYLKMFYQNVTRTREKLCLVVYKNAEVFKTLVRMLQ